MSKWALVTGVSSGGIGDALVNELLKNNVNVIATGLDEHQMDDLKARNKHASLHKLQMDVRYSSDITYAVSRVRSITGGNTLTGGRLDYLFNNAGYGYMMPLLDADLDAVRKNFEVNVFGLLAVTQAFFPLLQEAKGTVVIQSSIAGLPGVYQPYIGCYEASKSAVSKMSDVLRVELAPFDVKVRASQYQDL
jgi:1-acylglycerone phosphate reductase